MLRGYASGFCFGVCGRVCLEVESGYYYYYCYHYYYYYYH